MSQQKSYEKAWTAKCDADKLHEVEVGKWRDAVARKIENFQRHLRTTH
jgi:predicted sulfurtransferase